MCLLLDGVGRREVGSGLSMAVSQFETIQPKRLKAMY